jgi:uroporphyrin-III C-methyltransferase
MDALPSFASPPFLPGWVWLCGAGPGDPGLLTLHALHALREADVVVFDALVDASVLDWAPQAERVFAGKRGGKPSPKQRDISLRLVDFARAGRRVLRLKGGDPFVFGRGGEEGQTLVAHGVPIRVIPGVSAGIGGLGAAGIPVTHRDVNQSVTFVTGHDQSGRAPSALDWGAIARGSAVIVVYMGLKHAGQIAAALIAAGRSPAEPAAIVQNATLPAQAVVETTLGGLPEAAARLEPPAIICIGPTVLLRHALGPGALEADPLGLRARPASA